MSLFNAAGATDNRWNTRLGELPALCRIGDFGHLFFGDQSGDQRLQGCAVAIGHGWDVFFTQQLNPSIRIYRLHLSLKPSNLRLDWG